MRVSVVYDIKNTRRRNRVFKLLKDYGEWMELSAFECDISPKDFLNLQDGLYRLINRDEDKLIIYHLCDGCYEKTERVGVKALLEEEAYIV
ncbi:MAG: CRISPR-associated endonuclease Cas2 [bacterium]